MVMPKNLRTDLNAGLEPQGFVPQDVRTDLNNIGAEHQRFVQAQVLDATRVHVETDGEKVLQKLRELNLPADSTLYNEVASVLGLAVQGLRSAVAVVRGTGAIVAPAAPESPTTFAAPPVPQIPTPIDSPDFTV
jgi:hypothetical protein